MSKLTDTVLSLCRLSGISGWEDAVRDYIRAELTPYVDEIQEDALGNLLMHKKGRRDCGKTIVLAAHMDEVGLMIRKIEDDGYLRFGFVGGVDRRVVVGKQVFVGENRVPGVIGMKPIHLTTGSECESLPPVTELYLDIGAADKKAAEALTFPGDFAVFSDEVTPLSGGEVCVKAIDDRVGCGVLMELAKQELPMDLWFAFTVQEEVGTRGAYGANFRLKPDIAIIVEGTTAADNPLAKGPKKVCCTGKGPVIPFMDGGTVYDRELFEILRDLAEKNKIPWQTKTRIAGGTDARTFQRTAAAVRVCAVSAPVRYIHSPSSVGNVRDFDQMKQLLELLLQYLEENCHV